MSIKVRHLTVLGEFKPFGLIAEALDGKPVENVTDKYDYFLFNPQITRESEDTSDHDSSETASCDRSDHEIFIRGNRIIWSAGSRVQKRYTLPSSVIMVCWCRLGAVSEAFLCVLQIDTLTLYNTSGEEVCVPLPHSITSIWPLPFGLLLQQSTDGNCLSHVSFPSSSPSSNARDLFRPKKQIGYSPQNIVNAPLNSFDNIVKRDVTALSSHLILKDPLEEPQATFVEERGKLATMKDFDEITIWTSDTIPLMASYNKGKMQHSVWLVEVANSNLEATGTSLSDVVPCGVLPKQFCFRRIWQGKGAQSAASKVFLATDDDGVPVICFLLQEQKGLLSVRLQTVEMSNEILFDIKPDMSWSIPAISAAPVIVTHPRVKAGLLPFADIIVLASENNLLLYSGKQCLCRYSLPSGLVKGLMPHSGKSSESAAVSHDLRIIGLADAVEGRINIIVNCGRMFRCALRRSPSSSLANDCITAMAEGLRSNFYDHFLGLLWRDGESAYLSEADACVDAEWDSFSSIVMRMCQKYSTVILQKLPDPQPQSAWEFLITSKFHHTYDKCTYVRASSHATSRDLWDFECSTAQVEVKQSSGASFLVHFLMETLDCLHALYENLTLNNLRKRDLGLLVILLCNIAAFLGEESYLDYYVRDFPHLADKIGTCQTAISPRTPPCLLRWLDSCLRHGCHMANVRDLPPLLCKNGGSVVSWARKIVSFYSLLLGAERLGEKLSSGVYCNVAPGSYRSPEEHAVLAMVAERFGLQQLDLLPAGASLPLRHALDNCRESPPTDWPAAAYVLIGREDLALSCVEHLSKFKETECRMSLNLISISTPYMLRLHPVTIPSSISDCTGLDGVKIEDADSLDGSMADGMEHIFDSNTQLRYGRDMRLNEVRRLLCSARPVAIQTSTNPSASDQDHQQTQLWQLAQRTTALPLGRGAFTLATTCTLLTEVFVVPKLNLSGRLPSQQNATVNLDPNIRNIQELRSWPEFHNAVAAGLRLAPFQGKMSRTWILYNRPEEPNVTHAGLLLALGLHGYLRVLSVSDIFQYYSKEHESTTVGLMLGLAASYRGTMHPAISKSLYFHVPARHPSSFPELELQTLLQSAALMAIGLLYEGSAHPQTMQTLLGEIGRRSGGDNVLEREGYAVSAGSAMGLVALGRGEDVLGFMGTLVDRLFQYIDGKEFQNRSLTIIPSTDEQNRSAGQMMDGTSVNVDVTAPGAIIALALMFLKTESEVMASRLLIPHTHFELQYVRPDFIMLRVIARNLIMWSRVQPSREWILSQIPEIVKMGVMSIGDETADCDEMDVEALVQAYVNIVAGACISLGLRYAGTRNGDAQELLYNYAVYFLNEIKPLSVTSGITLPKGLSQYVDRGTLEICLHLIVLSLSVVMAGSGHLQTLRLLRFLRGRNSADGHASYGIQMAVSLAIGFLFLGGGMRTFSTSNTAVASLLITLYPRLPTGPNDNRCHLQAFRHLYVLATEARWVQTIDVDTGLPVYAPLEVTTVETENYAETSFCEISPCILPERADLKTVRVCGPRYWPQVIELVPEDKPWWSSVDKNNPFNCGIIYIKRKVGACSYVDDPIGCQSLLSRAMHKACDLTSLRACTANVGGIDELGSFKVDQLVSTFSTDPSLIAFAQLCCDPSWNSRSDVDFQDFCLQVLFECVSKDRPALLQVYVSLYTTLGSMAEQVTRGNDILGDSLFISSLKLALSYGDALANGRLSTSRGSILQSIFIGSLRKRVEEILSYSQRMKDDLSDYLCSGRWPHPLSEGKKDALLLSWFLKWFDVPPHLVVKSAVEKIKPKIKTSPSVPLLQIMFPQTHINAIIEIDNLWFSRVKS